MSVFQVWFRWLLLNLFFSTLALCAALRAGALGDDLANWLIPVAKAHGLQLIFLGDRAIHGVAALRLVEAFWATLLGNGWIFWLLTGASLVVGLFASLVVERGLGKVRGA